jgi:hypothetical protein
MRVEAIKVKDGFLLPFVEGLKTIKRNTILLDIIVLEQQEEDEIDQFFNRYHFNLNALIFDREEANAR